MFCRSCWANLPDGTERCPKCQNDPRVAVAPPSSAPAAAAPAPLAPPPRAPRPARGRGSNLAWVNMALALALGAVIAGPLLMRWWGERRTTLLSPEGGSAA